MKSIASNPIRRPNHPGNKITHGWVKHGMKGTTTYQSWENMKSRCNNPNNIGYQYYGARGISVCERWNKFENFLADMGVKPQGYMLERRNNDLGYSPENCEWATREVQNRNTRRTVRVEFNGRVMILKDWAKEMGISSRGLQARLRKWPLEIAMTTPVNPGVSPLTTEQNRNPSGNRFLTLNGKTQRIGVWAKELGICPATLRYRLKNWTIDLALTAPSGTRLKHIAAYHERMGTSA